YDERDAAAGRLSRAAAIMTELAAVDPDAAAPGESLEAAMAHVEEAVARVRALRDRVPSDPDRAEEIDARLDAILKLKRKYGERVEDIEQYRRDAAERLERIAHHDDL